jgi:hypothetical protein
MKSPKKQKSINLSKSTKFKILNIVLFIGIIIVSALNIYFSNNISKSIILKKQQTINQQTNLASTQAQADFYKNNPEIIQTISNVLPNQNSIIQVVEDIENLQKKLGIPSTFEFSSIVPTQDINNSYVSFIIKTNTTTLKAISFLRNFEKLPYLTNITSVNIKSPQGVGGPIELAISGRIYVQNPF